ncbi:MAG TPA: beta-phosphoglucomutase [Candidatus Scatomorpha pullicola]|nr:beta-phosphoglucomutase [Candidatus Scatomorpha pullicola]
MIKAIIFDLDGVLVSTDELHYRAWKALAGRLGVPFDRAKNDRCRGISRMASLDIVLEDAPTAYTQAERETFAAEKNETYRAMLASLTPADTLEGVLPTLAELRRRGYRLALASVSKNAPLILERTGLDRYLDAVADGNCITRSKPDPEVFLKAAEKLGMACESCAAMDDALAGIEAGRAAGMLTIGFGDSAKNKAGDLNLERFDELLGLFPDIKGR